MGVLHELLLKAYRSVDNQEKYSLYLAEGSRLSKRGKKNQNKTQIHPMIQDIAIRAANSRYSYKSSKQYSTEASIIHTRLSDEVLQSEHRSAHCLFVKKEDS